MPDTPARPAPASLVEVLEKALSEWEVYEAGDGQSSIRRRNETRREKAERLAEAVEAWVMDPTTDERAALGRWFVDKYQAERDAARRERDEWRERALQSERHELLNFRERDEAVALLRETQEVGNSEAVSNFLARLDGQGG